MLSFNSNFHFQVKYRPGVLESQVWAHGFLHGFVALGTYSASYDLPQVYDFRGILYTFKKYLAWVEVWNDNLKIISQVGYRLKWLEVMLMEGVMVEVHEEQTLIGGDSTLSGYLTDKK